MKHCVINFAKGAWYPRGQHRLMASLNTWGYSGDTFTFQDEAQLGSPTHQEAPYAFKVYALEWAAARGYDLVLWADASVWAIQPIEPMFEHIANHGHLFFYNCSTGNWSSDQSLAHFGLTRDQAFEVPMLMGLCMGWDLRTEKCKRFLAEWKRAIPTFPGSWTNAHREVSSDPRVYGHRHDQTAASIIAHQLEMPLVIAHETHFQYYANPNSTPYEQNPDMSLIKPCVKMVAQGM